MLPQLSRLSVRSGPGARLRHWCSSRYLCISPLHREFQRPLPPSSPAVSNAVPGLSPGISRSTYRTAYPRFTPSDSGQRSGPTYYRGCWHVVSRPLRRVPSSADVLGQPYSSPAYEVYTPKGFLPHAASLGQAFAHCPRFPTAASRRSLGRVSVPVWPAVLSDRLPIIALVGHYPTN